MENNNFIYFKSFEHSKRTVCKLPNMKMMVNRCVCFRWRDAIVLVRKKYPGSEEGPYRREDAYIGDFRDMTNTLSAFQS